MGRGNLPRSVFDSKLGKEEESWYGASAADAKRQDRRHVGEEKGMEKNSIF